MVIQGLALHVLQGMLAIGACTTEITPEEVLAVGGLAGIAGQAVAAVAVGHHHVVAHGQVLHQRAYGLDDARAFVPQHCGQRHGVILVAHDHVGVAHAGGNDTHQHLVTLWRSNACLLQHEGGTFATGYGSLDGAQEGVVIVIVLRGYRG